MALSAALIGDIPKLLECLDAFRGGGDAECLTQTGDCTDDRRPLRALIHRKDEASIHLDLVDGKLEQLAQRGIAGSKVIERNGDAQRPEAAEGGDRVRRLPQE